MAVSEEIVASLVEAVAALNQRVNDAASRPMIPGPQGEAGPQGEPGQDAPPVSYEEIKAAAAAWLRENITQPENGKDGQNGADGAPGRAPTEQEIQLAVDVWFEVNRESLRGPAGVDGANGADGRDGADGANGRDGRNGTNGADGVGIALIEQRDETSFWITLTDGQEFQIELPRPRVSGSFGGGGSGAFTGIDLGFY